ncbi:hypothetical protein [Nonomuraea sp. NPDC049129]|uniref:hypothetical protein n=1 Tax=Nonomuraea sp. NPDC049129 TaxID=3155272 RepID=UPI0033C364BB
MIGFGSNAMRGTTITEGEVIIGFTVKAGRYYAAYKVKGKNWTGIGTFDTNKQAVSKIMARRHAV